MTTNEGSDNVSDNSQTWTCVKLEGVGSIHVTNPSFPVPEGLRVIHNFLSNDEASNILQELDQHKWTWGGFTQKLRVQKYNSNEVLPPLLEPLVSRLEQHLNTQFQQVVIEEYPSAAARMKLCTNRVVTTFESLTTGHENDDGCFVAQVALQTPAMQHINCPQERHPECWSLKSPHHWTDIRMEPQALVIKTGEVLWDWRSRVSPLMGAQETDRVVVVKFFRLPDASSVLQVPRPVSSIPNGQAITDSQNRDLSPMPPLQEVLTIIVTTSPIRSNPSTELLEQTFATFPYAGDDFAFKCRKVIICDGCRVLEDDENCETTKVSRRHANVKQALRNGITTVTQAERYQEFKKNLTSLCENAKEDSVFWNSSVEELRERHGYGFALRHALEHCVSTPFVCVIQHDRTFMRTTPLRETVNAMWNNSAIKYVGMSMRSNLLYYDIFQSKFGKASSDEMKASNLILRPPQLELDASTYGPDSTACQELNLISENARKSTAGLSQKYKKSRACLEQMEWAKVNPPSPGMHQLTLTPTLFWYDNTHICETAHYRDFVFDPKFQMVARGGFVEDKLSPNIIKSVERLGLAEGHSRFGCYLLDDHSGTFFTGHLDGGNYVTKEEKEQFVNKK